MSGARRAFGLSFTLAASAAVLGLSGCDDPRRGWAAPAPTRFCVNGFGRRTADADCPSGPARIGGGGANWVYVRSGGHVPSVGEPMVGGRSAPEPGVSYRSAPVARGGFGGTGMRFFGGRFGGFGE
ncbi:MAG TPA: hypothetical protein VG939_04900 [Caulobacteraceae bacterium]|nr:hypothetical protein [Caulobacteraceae bacterium]